MSAESGSNVSGNVDNHVVRHDYNNNVSTSYKNSHSAKPSFFNGDAEQFLWWKSKMYNHFIGVDDELWNITENDVSFQVDFESMLLDRKSLTYTQKIYINHHRVQGILLEALPHSECNKIVDISTAKSIFESHCSTYEGNQQVKEVTHYNENARLPMANSVTNPVVANIM